MHPSREHGPAPLPVTPRRRRSVVEKRPIVAESYQPGVWVSVVARRNDVNANLVFTWQRRFREQGGFVPVVVEPDRILPPPDAGLSIDHGTRRPLRVQRDEALFDLLDALQHRVPPRLQLACHMPFGGIDQLVAACRERGFVFGLLELAFDGAPTFDRRPRRGHWTASTLCPGPKLGRLSSSVSRRIAMA